MPDELVIRDQLNEALFSAVHSGEHGLGNVPKLIKRGLQEKVWAERFVRAKRQHFAGFTTFEEYVKAVPPEGLGASIPLVRRLVADDPEALDMLDRALRRTMGDNKLVSNRNEHRPVGTTRGRALRALRDHRPDIHARVLAGELSPHAGMIEAGLRLRTVSIPLDPEKAAHYLRRHFSAAERQELIRHLLSNSEAAA
jgi:DNA-binding transcriptional ArsR family regulator